MNCGGCSYTGCDDSSDGVQVSVISTQVNWIVVINRGESLADLLHMLHINDLNYMAPRYRPGRTIVPATKDRFTNHSPA